MLSRFTFVLALAGALFALSLLPSRADTASDIKALQAAVATLQGQVKTLQSQNTSLQSQVNTLKSITSGFTRVTDTTRTDGKKGTELFLTGFNLHVVNGLGATNGDPNHTGTTQVNGLGNVIIGYDATRASVGDTDSRLGSHNLIVGDYQNYSSYGGVAFGIYNAIENGYASVTGGEKNTSSGFVSSVSGGYFNGVSGEFSSISGGHANTISGFYDSISGGDTNTASGESSSVSGGLNRTASGSYNWAAGGYSQPD